MTADTQAQGDLVKLIDEYGLCCRHEGRGHPLTELLRDRIAAALQGRGTQEGEPSDERKAFEHWCARQEDFEPEFLNRRDFKDSERIGEYVSGSIEWQWKAWQHRAALAQESRVSVEIREAM